MQEQLNNTVYFSTNEYIKMQDEELIDLIKQGDEQALTYLNKSLEQEDCEETKGYIADILIWHKKDYKKAYEILGKDISLEKSISDTTKNLLCKNMSFGKCLTEQLTICDCDVSYKEKYYEDFEEDIDYDEDEYDEYDE